MRYFWAIAILTAAAFLSAPARTQAAQDEFSEFKSQMEAAKTAAPAADPANNAAAIEGALEGNPLGPAANLPVDGPLIPGAGALAPQTPEELQVQMEAEAEVQKQKLEDATFNAALRQLLPLKPEQIRRLLESFRISREAAETPIRVPAPKVEVQTLSLDPGQMPPTIRTAPGHVATIALIDSTGAPWPIQDLTFAGPFDVAPPEEGGHVIRITAKSAHAGGNMSVRMVDLITPITFSLSTSLDEVHYRLDIRLPKPGPNAKSPLIEYGGINSVAGGDDNLMTVLEGRTPSESERLNVKGTDGRTTAFLVSGKVYLRTPLTLLSPAWEASVGSADGMNVYTMNNTPIVLLSDNGRMVRAQIAPEVMP